MNTIQELFLTAMQTPGKKTQELLVFSSLNLPYHGNEADAIFAFVSLLLSFLLLSLLFSLPPVTPEPKRGVSPQ